MAQLNESDDNKFSQNQPNKPNLNSDIEIKYYYTPYNNVNCKKEGNDEGHEEKEIDNNNNADQNLIYTITALIYKKDDKNDRYKNGPKSPLITLYKTFTLQEVNDLNIKLKPIVRRPSLMIDSDDLFDNEGKSSNDNDNGNDNNNNDNYKKRIIDFLNSIGLYNHKNDSADVVKEFFLIKKKKNDNGDYETIEEKVGDNKLLGKLIDKDFDIKLKLTIPIPKQLRSKLVNSNQSSFQISLLYFKQKTFRYTIKPIITLGTRVKRGKDWCIQNDLTDGGKDGVGIIIGYKSWYNDGNRDAIYVYWEKTSKVCEHRFGAENAYSVSLAPHSIINKNNEEMNCPRCLQTNLAKYCQYCNLCVKCGVTRLTCVLSTMGTFNSRIKCICGCAMIKKNIASINNDNDDKKTIMCDDCSKEIVYNDENKYYYSCLFKNLLHIAGRDYHEKCAIDNYVEYDLHKPNSPENPLVIVLVGEAGIGKSSLGNTILGLPDAFKSAPSKEGCTKTSLPKLNKWLDNDNCPYVCVIDTPGLLDSENKEDAYMEEAIATLNLMKNGVNVFLFVLDGTRPRLSKNIYDAADILHKHFGEKFWEHVVLVYNKCDIDAPQLWHKNLTAHQEAADDFKKKYGFSGDLDIFHVSIYDTSNFDDLLKCIQQKLKYHCDWYEKMLQANLIRYLEGIAIMNALKRILDAGDDDDNDNNKNDNNNKINNNNDDDNKNDNDNNKKKNKKNKKNKRSFCAIM